MKIVRKGSVCSTNSAPVFQSLLINETAKVLGMLDRDSYSQTFGSIDRVYWAWKFTDFPGARFQEGLCYLSYLYSTELEGNAVFHNEAVKVWLQGGIRNWAAIQSRSGDFDEAYPGERSLAATAFTGFYISEAYLFLNGHLDDDVSRLFKQSLDKAAAWLCVNDESHGILSNHLAAAAATMLHAHRILGSDKYFQRYRYFLNKILDYQSDEGWYEEYGGADPGYQTHGMFYLARCYELTDDDELLDSLRRSCEFLKHFIHPDRSLGGEYASRNTQTYYPAAFEMLAERIGSARWIASEMRTSVHDGSATGLLSVDAYNYFPLLNNYVFALRAGLSRGAESVEPAPPPSQAYSMHFPKAGLLKVRRDRFDLLVGISKGGVIKLFDRKKRRLLFSSCGYIGRTSNGKLCSNQTFNADATALVSETEVEQVAQFFSFSRPVMTPVKFLLFRIFSLSTGRFSTLASWLKRLLVKVLIYRKNELQLELRRKIRIDENGIVLIDRICGAHLKRLRSLQHKSIFTTIHMGSSRYFIPNELEVPDVIESMEFDSGTAPESIEFQLRIDVPNASG